MYSAPLRRLLPAGLVAVFAAACLAFVVVATAQEGTPPVATGSGEFSVACGITENEPDPFSHRARVDPIVGPGQNPFGHLHDFFGNKATNEDSVNDGSSAEDLRLHLTTCVRSAEDKNNMIPLNRTGYWVPALIEGTRPVAFHEAAAAYHVGRRERTVVPFPQNFKMIAGNSSGAPTDPADNVFDWRCGSQSGGTVTPGTATTFPQCAGPGLRLTITFPDCWDGENADSADHKSHVAYSKKVTSSEWRCPASHPEELPALKIQLHYAADGGADTGLSSTLNPSGKAGPETTHADFMNGWDREHLEFLVRECLNADTYCGNGLSPHPNRD